MVIRAYAGCPDRGRQLPEESEERECSQRQRSKGKNGDGVILGSRELAELYRHSGGDERHDAELCRGRYRKTIGGGRGAKRKQRAAHRRNRRHCQQQRHRLLPGMVCDVSVVSPGRAASASLPANIVQIDTDNRPFVWTLSGGKAKKTMIKVGGYAGDRILVSSGLRAGDKVIVEGQQKVSNGMKVSE